MRPLSCVPHLGTTQGASVLHGKSLFFVFFGGGDGSIHHERTHISSNWQFATVIESNDLSSAYFLESLIFKTLICFNWKLVWPPNLNCAAWMGSRHLHVHLSLVAHFLNIGWLC